MLKARSEDLSPAIPPFFSLFLSEGTRVNHLPASPLFTVCLDRDIVWRVRELDAGLGLGSARPWIKSLKRLREGTSSRCHVVFSHEVYLAGLDKRMFLRAWIRLQSQVSDVSNDVTDWPLGFWLAASTHASTLPPRHSLPDRKIYNKTVLFVPIPHPPVFSFPSRGSWSYQVPPRKLFRGPKSGARGLVYQVHSNKLVLTRGRSNANSPTLLAGLS